MNIWKCNASLSHAQAESLGTKSHKEVTQLLVAINISKLYEAKSVLQHSNFFNYCYFRIWLERYSLFLKGTIFFQTLYYIWSCSLSRATMCFRQYHIHLSQCPKWEGVWSSGWKTYYLQNLINKLKQFFKFLLSPESYKQQLFDFFSIERIQYIMLNLYLFCEGSGRNNGCLQWAFTRNQCTPVS